MNADDIIINSKLPNVGTSIFAVMTGMAKEYNAHNLSQGFPEFNPHPWLMQRVSDHITAGHNQYAPMIGTEQLRQAISDKIEQFYGQRRNPDTEITITSGATEAIFAAIQSTVAAGDEVIIFDPAYDCYAPATRLSGGTPIHLPLLPGDFGIDWAALESAINDKTRMIVINSPHNPTGATLSMSDLDKLAELMKGSNCLLLSDEVYEHIIFDGQSHASALQHDFLKQRSFVVSSFGKTYHATGWKVGYCIAPPEMTVEFRKLHQLLTFATSTPMQLGIADMMNEQPDYPRELVSFYQSKRDCFANAIKDSRFEVLPCHGTYFMLLDYSAISDLDDMAFTEWLTKEKGIATIPLSPFYEQVPDQKIIRCCFAKSEQTLATVGALLSAL